jgi:hypothetical protein
MLLPQSTHWWYGLAPIAVILGLFLLVGAGLERAGASSGPDVPGAPIFAPLESWMAASSRQHAPPQADQRSGLPSQISADPGGAAFSEASPPPLALSIAGLNLSAVSSEPVFVLSDALAAVATLSPPWRLDTGPDGRPSTLTAAHGLATFGWLGSDGGWRGLRRVPLPDGTILDHIDGRPMWILDFGNVHADPGGNPTTPIPTPNHAVFAVDDQAGAVIAVWTYRLQPSA